ncbi:MAG: RAMP superfamily CRISPR-associated protein [Filifactor alocis]|nr:RAMP superfamily CRISPR-associated protein [Filifactor alocis]
MLLLLKGILTAKTPFMIGSGKDEGSDSDVLRNGRDEIFIPGTTLAGVCRHFLEDGALKEKQQKIETAENQVGEKQETGDRKKSIIGVFGGKIGRTSDSRDTLESKIIFYDAFETAKTKQDLGITTKVRDSVRLNHKVSVDKSKFDYEVVEAGASFKFRVEWLTEDKEFSKGILSRIIEGLNKGDIRIGAKTTRGFGEFELTEVRYAMIDLNKNMSAYISLGADWDLDKNGEVVKWKAWEQTATTDYESAYKVIRKEIALDGFLFLRDYATLAKTDPEDKESKFVDAQTLVDRNGNPVIPGTAWAGAFRHHCAKILKRAGHTDIEALLDAMFGYRTKLDDKGELKRDPNDKEKKSKSNIIFRETTIHKETVVMLNRTRSAIDRFSGSALQTGALFTERIACAKDGESPLDKFCLEIKIRKDIEDFAMAESLIDVCIQDLERGLLAVGGNTSIGAGMFKGLGKEEERDARI